MARGPGRRPSLRTSGSGERRGREAPGRLASVPSCSQSPTDPVRTENPPQVVIIQAVSGGCAAARLFPIGSDWFLVPVLCRACPAHSQPTLARRYTALLASSFRHHTPALALSLLSPKLTFSDEEAAAGAMEGAVVRADGQPLSPYDMKRLQSYSSNLVDHHLARRAPLRHPTPVPRNCPPATSPVVCVLLSNQASGPAVGRGRECRRFG